MIWCEGKKVAPIIMSNIYKTMPRFNRTGPMGQGPRTGRGMGPCGGGMARGRGTGRGFGWNAPQMTKKEQEGWLKEEAEALEEELKAVKEEIAQLKKDK